MTRNNRLSRYRTRLLRLRPRGISASSTSTNPLARTASYAGSLIPPVTASWRRRASHFASSQREPAIIARMASM